MGHKLLEMFICAVFEKNKLCSTRPVDQSAAMDRNYSVRINCGCLTRSSSRGVSYFTLLFYLSNYPQQFSTYRLKLFLRHFQLRIASPSIAR